MMGSTESDSLLLTVVKAFAAGFASFVPVFIYLYLEEPRLRWAMDEWLADKRYRLWLWRWARRWHALGWRQEIQNQRELPPEELRGPAPDWIPLPGERS